MSKRNQSPEKSYSDVLEKIMDCESRGKKSLYLMQSNLAALPPEINRLQHLEKLVLHEASFEEVPRLDGLKNLKVLAMWNAPLRNLDFLQDLPQLEEFSIIAQKLTDLSALAGMKNLNRLNLSDLNTTDIAPLCALPGLKKLYLHRSAIRDLTFLAKLPPLETLGLGGIELNDLGPVTQQPSLTKLIVPDNQIADISALVQLPALRDVMLNGNRITDISPLAKLSHLRKITLSENPVTDLRPLRPWILDRHPFLDFTKAFNSSKHETYLELHDCPLTDPPLEIAMEGPQAILDYWLETELRGVQRNFEGRLIIVGEGAVGKTTLLRKLENENFPLDPQEPQTHGINILSGWSFPCRYYGLEETFTANVWDFGGQDIQYLTHQFFLSPGAVYVLLINQRRQNTAKEMDQFNYWFRIIDLLGREANGRARVLVVHNERDTDGPNYTFDISPYERAYEKNLDITFHRVNLARTDGAFRDLRATVQTSLAELPHIGTDTVKGWNDIRRVLRERRAERRLSFGEYAAVCRQFGIDSERGQLLLSGYLHRLGELLHFAQHPQLFDFVVLDVEWVTEIVYAILRDQTIIDARGYFTEAQVMKLWEEAGIDSRQDRNRMFRLLQVDAFELCFPVAGGYLAPQLLGEHEPAGISLHDVRLRLRYDYPFLPKGLLSQLIVRLHGLIEDNHFWRYGVYVRTGGARARVRRNVAGSNAGNTIDLEVSGEELDAYALLAQIRREIATIHREFFSNLRVKLRVPCGCPDCEAAPRPHYFDLEKLERYHANGRPQTYCQIDDRPRSIRELLTGINSPQDPALQDDLGTRVRARIRENDARGALREMRTAHGENDAVVQIQARLQELEDNRINGTLSLDEEALETRRINEVLLLLAKRLSERPGRGNEESGDR